MASSGITIWLLVARPILLFDSTRYSLLFMLNSSFRSNAPPLYDSCFEAMNKLLSTNLTLSCESLEEGGGFGSRVVLQVLLQEVVVVLSSHLHPLHQLLKIRQRGHLQLVDDEGLVHAGERSAIHLQSLWVTHFLLNFELTALRLLISSQVTTSLQSHSSVGFGRCSAISSKSII